MTIESLALDWAATWLRERAFLADSWGPEILKGLIDNEYPGGWLAWLDMTFAQVVA